MSLRASKRVSSLVMLMSLLAALVYAVVSGSPAEATFEGDNGRIFYRKGSDIGSVKPDGTGKRLEVDNSGFPGTPQLKDPSVSPNGKVLAFTTSGDIWTKNTVTGRRKNVTKNASDDLTLTQLRYPAWSPDGQRIVFQAVKKTNGIFYARLYRINADGTGIKQLIRFNQGHFGIYETDPDWGETNMIVYSALDDLWLIQPDGGGDKRLTTDGENYYDPSWSPDGTEIAVHHENADVSDIDDQTGIWAVNAETGTLRPITGNGPTNDHVYQSPAWSPDGQFVVFEGTNGTCCTEDLYIVPAAGGAIDDLDARTTGGNAELAPAWGVKP